MTEQEAIKHLKDAVYGGTEIVRIRAILIGIQALEKQIPKKPVFEDGFIGVYKCLSCKTIVGNAYGKGVTYCPECGNAIDWSEEE